VTIVHTALRAVLFVLVEVAPAFAQSTPSGTEPAPNVEMKAPRLSFADVDWDAARAKLTGIDQAAAQDKSTPDALMRLNSAAETILPYIAVSPVPVLLPFDTASYLRDEAQGATGDAKKYFFGFLRPVLFFPGPSGYDALFSLQPGNISGLDLSFARNVDVLITGSAFTYDLEPAALSDVTPVPELATDFPDLRRVLLEERLRYAFTRFGVPYVVSIACNDGANSAHRLSCRDADKVAVRFLKALTIAGGTPPNKALAAAQVIDRPAAQSPDFTFYAPGDLLPGTGMKGRDGSTDATVYSKITYPMAQAPDYINSQSFMNWGDCNFTGRVGVHGDGKTPAYRCRVNSIPLVDDESKNYAYPWRDNFCEHRDFYVGQCPAGLGHQGEDMRPGSCLFRTDGAGRCDPYQNDLVAVRDGVLMRNPGDEALYLIADSPGEHVRFRYLHMDPQMLDGADFINNRAVSEGEVLGAVDDYERRQAGTSYHLHFNVQVFSRDGWVFVNPYMTLVAAYERLIGGRGQAVRDAVVATASTASPNPIVAPPKSESGGDDKADSTDNCTTRFVSGHRRRICGLASVEHRWRRRRTIVQSVDSDVPH
jgi:hypothetical protein